MNQKITLEAAPADESLDQVVQRFVVVALRHFSACQNGIAEIDAVADLRERSFFGDEPSENEWIVARKKLAIAIAIALDRDLVGDAIVLLGDRVQPIPSLDARILNAIEVEKSFGLDMRTWHCNTTHCRAGSACFMHPLGSELERVFGNWIAGAIIYKISTNSIPDFYASNEVAMADIRRCAAEQDAIK